jgi:magnesium-transporting ATPase (P-type)
MMVALRNKKTGKIKAQKIGWSWTCLFFSIFFGIPLFIKKLYGSGAVMLLLVWVITGYTQEQLQEVRQGTYQYSTAGAYVKIIVDGLPIVLAIIFAATANRMAGRKYLRHDWEFAEPNSETTQTARRKWGIAAPSN